MKKKIVIAGGTGFIGQYLTKEFVEAGFEVKIISRDPRHIPWNSEDKIREALEGAEVLINLAGRSVDCRYTKKNQSLILSSRVETTRKLQSVIDQCIDPPKLWINASTATIYRHSLDKAMEEETGEIGAGFSVQVARAWEGAFFEKPCNNTRKVALRIAIVLGKNGGVMKAYTHLVRLGLGGKQGRGNQMFSWIHVEDLYRIIQFIIGHKEMEGIYNCSAPYPVTNKVFMLEMRKALKPFIHFSSPKWLLKIGALFIGTETELVLKSRWVIPKKLLASGFAFKYPTIEKGLGNVFE